MAGRSLHVEVNREPSGYWAEIPDLPGCFASGATFDGLLEALSEAVSLYLTSRDDDQQSDDVSLDRILTRVTGLQLEVEPDARPPGADALSRPPEKRKRQAHRDDWPPRFGRDAPASGDEHR